jgi:hypothetical protein
MSPARARQVLSALALGSVAWGTLAGCAAAPVAGEERRPAATERATGRRGPGPTELRGRTNPSGAEVAKILGASGLAFDTVAEDRQWRLVFAGRQLPRVTLFVLYGGTFTAVMGRLFTVPPTTGVEFYRAVARKNYDFDQLKLSVDGEGGLYASFEVPTRILDERELMENIFGLASAMDEVGAELARFAAPGESAPGESAPSPDERPQPLPAGRGPLIEAWRARFEPLLARLP